MFNKHTYLPNANEARKMADEERGSYSTCAGIDRSLPIWAAAARIFLFLFEAGIAV